jgi:hypothetical protein
MKFIVMAAMLLSLLALPTNTARAQDYTFCYSGWQDIGTVTEVHRYGAFGSCVDSTTMSYCADTGEYCSCGTTTCPEMGETWDTGCVCS